MTTTQDFNVGGGPAFPAQDYLLSDDPNIVNPVRHRGMTLRDYFAVHSTQPGMAEIVKAAGFVLDSSNRVQGTGETTGGGLRFDVWWQSLPLARQCELSALVRYAQADAMLAVGVTPNV